MKTNHKGFTLVEIMIVVAIIALLAAIAIPSFMKSRAESRKSACINNLRLIDHAKQQYGTSTNVAETYQITQSDITAYLKTWPICPAAGPGSYTPGPLASNPSCSYHADLNP